VLAPFSTRHDAHGLPACLPACRLTESRCAGVRSTRSPARSTRGGSFSLRHRLQRLLHGRRARGRDRHLHQRRGRRPDGGSRLLLQGQSVRQFPTWSDALSQGANRFGRFVWADFFDIPESCVVQSAVSVELIAAPRWKGPLCLLWLIFRIQSDQSTHCVGGKPFGKACLQICPCRGTYPPHTPR